ncbi:MAG: threonine synthase [Ekhidna sp.]|nr:threonine synthase [Ekhidna sp.]
MNFFSTNDRANKTSFRESVIKSLPADNGLYFPEVIPSLDLKFLESLHNRSLPEIAYHVLSLFSEPDIPSEKLQAIIEDTFIFDIPLVRVEENIYCLELFHGPTMAFKDVGARFLARTLSYFQEAEDEETTILVATSGDTGGAVASGFFNQAGINVVILYPSGKVTPLQDRQMTTLGGNIKALEVDGDFDDCQALVKQAFLDKNLNQRMKLSSANSINIARWLPQSIYYYIPFMLRGLDEKIVCSVPSGNYGNVTSGMLAKKMGLPIHRFIAASNANDVVPRYLESGVYEPYKTIQTIANAMDVSKPSNFTRLETLYDHDLQNILRDTSGYRLDDEGTRHAMQACYHQNNYLMDPHSSIAYKALHEQLQEGEEGIFLGTAHHSKFMNVMHEAIHPNLELPEKTKQLFEKERQSEKLKNDYKELKAYFYSFNNFL